MAVGYAYTKEPLGYRWRSSKALVIACIALALFSDTFLYSFVVPILSHILEDRLNINPKHAQFYTSVTLAFHGFVGMIASPIVGYFSDKSPNRRIQLLVSLVGCMVGTLLVAGARSLWVFLLGRFVQGFLGSAVWVIGFATAAETVGEDNVGKAMSFAMVFVTAGGISGPMVAGLLFQVVGYWPTWSAPFAVLFLGTIAGLAMLEKSDASFMSPSSCSSSVATLSDREETNPLLEQLQGPQSQDQQRFATETSFYREIISNRRVLTSLFISISTGIVMASFPTTLPLHVQEVFGWETSNTGLMFFCLQVPMIIFGPVSGWLRDRVGLRYPAAVSMALLSPTVWLTGVPGDKHFPWASASNRGPAIYIASLATVGSLAPFLRGVAALELTAIVKERQIKDPGIFGPNGGLGRALSIADIASTLAMMAGPIVSGSLHSTVGYYYMNLVYAVISISLSIASFCFLTSKYPKSLHLERGLNDERDANESDHEAA